VIREPGGARRHDRDAARPQDRLHRAHRLAPVVDVLEHLGRDHDVEAVRAETVREALGGADLVHARPEPEVDAEIGLRPERFDVAP
jgi:hypothetical protein